MATTLPPVSASASIIDNASPETTLLNVLNMALRASTGVDACVGYLHMRGWDAIANTVEDFRGVGIDKARVLVGMHADPQQEMRVAAGVHPPRSVPDGPTRARMQRNIKEQFEKQIAFGLPSNGYQATLERLNRQLRENKVQIKLYTRNRLHAKLYLSRRNDQLYPRFGIVGSSNLTAPGLWAQGELNVAVHSQDDCVRLQHWFDERWDDDLNIDITDVVARLIETGWPNDGVLPYHVYLRMAYHVATDGLEAEREFPVPAPFDTELFGFQKEAVCLAAKKLLRENGFEGVMLADVVGLGKTYMASAVLKIFQNDRGDRSLIVCPKNLESMWQHFVERYGLNARVLPISLYKDLAKLPGRYGCVLIDESHNLRNRKSKRWEAISHFIDSNRARVLLLTATPLNKHYDDIGAQLRLFLDADADLGIWPTQYMRALHESQEIVPHRPTSLSAFEGSPYAQDWRELLRLFMVRRTRQYLIDRKFAAYDEGKDRFYLLDSEDTRRYFPKRQPKTLTFACNEDDPSDQFARLYSDGVVSVIEHLQLPRYGLALHVDPGASIMPNHELIVKDLGRAGRRLLGYCRMNLFKRLESSGHSFLMSIERHILRNLVFEHALVNGLDIPIGQQDPELMDPAIEDEDLFGMVNDDDPEVIETAADLTARTMEDFRAKAQSMYERYSGPLYRKFRWLPAEYFKRGLRKSLKEDAEALLGVLNMAGSWEPERDENLKALHRLITNEHGHDKVLIFTQFADTAAYLAAELERMGVSKVGLVTGGSANPTELARRFSPESNEATIPSAKQLRVLIATDVLSEGQNLQDSHVVINYDLPWAIIRLIQRAGRVDRIGQDNATVYCYSFCFGDSHKVETIIKLRKRLTDRLQMMGEVIGTDEQFIGEHLNVDEALRRLYAEDPDVLQDKDGEVDLASEALKIWHAASKEDQDAALALQHNAYATRKSEDEDGVLVFARFGPARFGVARVAPDGALKSESLGELLKAAACTPANPAQPRHPDHHDLVSGAVRQMSKERRSEAGRLGSPREIRRRVYERLRDYIRTHESTLMVTDTLRQAVQRIYDAPLLEPARESLSRQMRLGVSHDDLAELVQRLYEENRLCTVASEVDPEEPELICSMGLWRNVGGRTK